MFAVERLGSFISKGVYTVSGPFHIFGGAVDIIVVQHPDGSFKSAPWYVKFGKFQGVLKSKEKVVTISVNGSEAGFHMYLDHKGEAYFLKEEEEEEESIIIVSSSSSSSSSSSGEELDEPSQIPSRVSISADHNSSDQLKNSPHIDTSTANGKIVARSRSRILGFVFGRKSDDDKNRQGKNSNDNVQRISSLERAEIAADLLEMKWSTNLPTHNFKASAIHPRVTNDASFLSASSSSSDNQYEHTLISSSSSPSIPSGISDSTPNKSIMFHDEIGVTTDDDLGTRVLESEYSHELSPRSTGVLFNKENLSVHCAGSSDTQKQIFDISDPRCSGLMDSLGRLSELSMPDYSDNVCEEKGTPSLSLLSPDAAGVQVSLSICTSSGQNNELLENFISAEQIGHNSNKNYSKATRVSTFEVDFVHEQGLKQNVSDKEPGLHTESSSTPTGSRVLTGKGNLSQCTCSEIGLSIDEEDCCKFDTVDADCGHDGDLDRCDCSELRLLVGEVSRKFDAANADYRKEETSEMLISNTSDMDASAMNGADDLVTESPHSLDIHLQRSDSIEAEAVEVFHSDDVPDKKRVAFDTMTVNVILEKNLEAEPSEVSQNIAESMSSSSSSLCRLGDNERLDQGSGAQMLREEIFKDPKSHAPMANLSNTIPRVQEFENLGYEVEMYELGLSSKAIFIPQESVCMQDDQFHFSDSDIFASSGVSRELSSSTDIEEEDNPPPLACDGVEEQRVPNSIHHGSAMALSLESQPFPSNSKPGEVGTRSTPINVPQIYRLSRKAKRLPESLPNIMSHIRDLGSSDDLHPLSSSLDLNSEHLKWGSMFKEYSSSLKMEGTPEGEYSIPDQPATEVADDELAKSPSELEIEGILAANPAVELSLCKHLLFEGMGTDAASKVFDAEKVSHEKIIALVGGLSSIVKNDRLVVRIDDHYFPWDAAAPIILGMVSFGPEQIFTPQGMISVNRVEKTLDKHPSVPAGISWNLWPFSFKKSKTLSSVPSPRRDPNATNANSASGNVRGIMPENSMRRRNPLKKKVRSLIPTSKQLASLNLREGQNVITFSFSTAMLGRQQVDARIYLWKWNTQIVISDVDGTITKSDVLGQFMPLVGKDWSQSGVAHLFSAIKGNGYQLLFLSARAISQAYLTRQFLLNLKQDGEALPDGPVVISPDGLFPSLFREVIRRTPHEFKISCLEGIRALFPPSCNPFYAGFGNRDTDEISYLKVGIPKGKIFTINPKGEVAVNRRVNTKSYTSLHSLVDNMFPAMYSEEQEDFNSWNYWKVPVPDINI